MKNIAFYSMMLATAATAGLAVLGGSAIQVAAPIGLWASAAAVGLFD